jgi:DNA processing protein
VRVASDTAAHQGALAAKGRTVCVLGTAINIVFPPENKDLFERIAENGAVLSQFPFNRNGDKQSFAIRNRIVAGMTLGAVVGRSRPAQRCANYSKLCHGIWSAGVRRARAN